MAPNNRQSAVPTNAQPDFELKESAIVAVGVTINLPISDEFPHNFVGVQFFADAAGLIPATPGAGTVTIMVETLNTLLFEAPPDSVITAATPTTVSWDANTRQVKAIPAGITVATHYKLVWTGNRS